MHRLSLGIHTQKDLTVLVRQHKELPHVRTLWLTTAACVTFYISYINRPGVYL